MALQTLARSFLFARDDGREDVRLLCATLRHCRDQQQLLSIAVHEDVRLVEGIVAARFLLRSEGKPLYHAHEETEGSEELVGEVLSGGGAVGGKAGADSFSTATEMEVEYGATGGVSRGTAG